MEVTPDGVFPRADVRADGGVGALGPNPSPAGLRWVYPNPGGVPWITTSASVGAGGSLAWLGQTLNGQRLSLVATTDDAGTPPAFIWEVATPGATVLTKAADKAAACAVAVLDSSAPSYELRYYTSSSATPLWIATRAASFEIAISDNGRYVAAGTSTGANSSAVDVYDAQSGTPSTPIATLNAVTHAFRHLDISGDGSRVLLATHTFDHVFDVATQTPLFTASTVSHDAHTMNRDGKVFARGGFNPLRAWWETSGTYNQVLSFSDGSLGFPVYTACDVSADGSTLVAAAYDANSNERMRVYCFRLTPTSSQLLWTYASDGSGARQDVPQAISVSDNGRWAAVASWGAEFNDHPEVLLFDRDAGNVPVHSIDTPGSAFDVDLSGDAQFMVAGTKAVHANVFGNGGEGYSFDRGGQDHWLRGTLGQGRTIRVRTGGNPGESVAYLFAAALWAPFPVPGINGLLIIDPSTLILGIVVGSIPAGGVHERAFVVPTDPSLIGGVLYTQALRIGPPHEFTNALCWLFVP